jgi:diguanylate cyclase (GGDEF)-like protein/PAS domain S-box-containing protein
VSSDSQRVAASQQARDSVVGGIITEAPESRLRAIEMMKASFARAPTGVALIDLDGRLILVNDELCRLLGRPEHELIGTTALPLADDDDDDWELTKLRYADLRDGGRPLVFEKTYVRPDGETVCASTRAAAVAGPDGRPTHIVAHVMDITALRDAELKRSEATRMFETAFADAPIGMALVSLEGRWLRVNSAVCELLGYSESELLQLTFQEITHPDDLDADLRLLDRLVAGEIDRYTLPKRYFRKDGDDVWASLSVSLVRDDQGRAVNFISQIVDISERRRLELALQHRADHDHLTELWNRRAFEHELRRQIAQCRRHPATAALLIVDLDDFKRVNDTHGHAAGDELLVRVARCLRTRLRTSDRIARIGGDEFAVILPDTSDEQAAVAAAALCEAIRQAHISVGDQEVGVTASIGVSAIDEHVTDERAALAAADLSMYEVKARQRRLLG